MQHSRLILAFASFLLFLGILFGAFGAHLLQQHVSAELLSVWQTAVQYQLIQALGLLVLGASRISGIGRATSFIAVGICVFSGSLYLLVLTGLKWFGAITPFGGLLMMLGWLMLAYQFWRSRVI